MNREERLTRAIYGRSAEDEWRRLRRDAFHDLEWSGTLATLERHLPKRGRVLDAGGGPGRYTVELARRGYDVVLLDLVDENLDVARRKIRAAGVASRVSEVVQGSIIDLSRFEDASFDAVLCLGGPLSHVHPERARRQAVRELVRVARPGAPIFVSVFGRFGTLARGVSDWSGEYADAAHFERFWRRGDDYRWRGRHYAHYFTAEELCALFPRTVERVALVGLEGLASSVASAYVDLAKRSPKACRNWRKAHEALCTHPTVVDMSAHMLFVGRTSGVRTTSTPLI